MGIDRWWPLLEEQIRIWLVNNIFSPIAPYTRGEIERVGGPARTTRAGSVKATAAYTFRGRRSTG